MRRRRWRWEPDNQGLIKAAIGLVAGITGTALPLGAAADAILSLVRIDGPGMDAWHDRLVDEIRRWTTAHPDVVASVGELPTGWERSLLEELGRIDATTLLGSDPRTRSSIEEALARTVFTPLTKHGWKASQRAAKQLADDLPELVVSAAGSDPGLAALRQLLKGDLAAVLDRLPPEPADQTALEAYLTALIDELDQDSWTRLAGRRESSLTAMAQSLSVHARADTGYSAEPDDAEITDANELASRCERLVVCGGPGAGKTWLARRTAINAAESAHEAFAAQADPASVEIPLFARFARSATVFASGLPAWRAVVTAALQEVADRLGPGRVSEALERRFLEQPGRYLVVLDGLDEADYLPGNDMLDRLTVTAGRELRILLTTRPGSWRRQLPLAENHDGHRLADLQPLRYPEDVTAIIDAWLVGHEAARKRLVALLEQRAELAQAARTPLLCAMYCLLAESQTDLPVGRREMYDRVVTNLLQGTWRREQLNDQQLALAWKALRELAWAGASYDPASGLAAWPTTIRHTFTSPLPDAVLAAVSHVSPMAQYDPVTSHPSRQFIHPSIREHLVAKYLASLSVGEAKALIEPHLWYDPQWEQVLPAAVAGHPNRDALLQQLLVGDGKTPATLDERDGFGELRRLLARLAAETAPADWNAEHAALIDGVSRDLRAAGRSPGSWLAAAANGWPGIRPGAEVVARLGAGVVPWPRAEIRYWVGHLELTSADRGQLINALVGALGKGHREHGSIGRREKTDIVLVLDALGMTAQQRATAIDLLVRRLRHKDVDLGDIRALKALDAQFRSDELAQSILQRMRAETEEYVVYEWAEVLDLLEADEAVRRAAAQRVLDLLARLPERENNTHFFVEAIKLLRPKADQVARAIDLLLRRLAKADSYVSRVLMGHVRDLLPLGDGSRDVLQHLVQDAGPWTQTNGAAEVLERLAARLPWEDRRAVVDIVARQVEAAADWQTHSFMELHSWVEHLVVLAPTMQEREALIECLLARLPTTPMNSIGFVTQPARTLGANADQRRRLVQHLVDQLPQVDIPLRVQVCEMAGWFVPEGEARSTAVATLIDAAESLNQIDLISLKWAATALALTDHERQQLLDPLIGHLAAWKPYEVLSLATTIAEIGATREQRTTAADLLLGRLNGPRTHELQNLILALQAMDSPSDWRTAAARIVVDALLDTPLEVVEPLWPDLVTELELSSDDRQRLLDALLDHLQPETFGLGRSIRQALESLDPDGARNAAIADRLIAVLASTPQDDAYTADRIAWILARRRLTAEQGRAVVRQLLTRISTAATSAGAELLATLTQFPMESDDRRAAVVQAVRYFEEHPTDGSVLDTLLKLSELGELDEESRRRAIDASLGTLAGRVLGADDRTLQRLTHLGLDAAALLRSAKQASSSGERFLESTCRQLARTLRHTSDLATWLTSLSLWADVHQALYPS